MTKREQIREIKNKIKINNKKYLELDKLFYDTRVIADKILDTFANTLNMFEEENNNFKEDMSCLTEKPICKHIVLKCEECGKEIKK